MATSEQEKRAADWQAMLSYGRQIACIHIGRKPKPKPIDDEEELPKPRIKRRIGTVHKRKFTKVAA